MAARPQRGEVWWANLGRPEAVMGHEQATLRPVVIVSANFVNESAADMVIILPITTSLRPVRSHIRVEPPEGGLQHPSSVQCEQVRALSAGRLRERIGRLPPDTLRAIDRALRLILALS